MLRCEERSDRVALPNPHTRTRCAAGLVHAAFPAMMIDALIEQALRGAMRRERLEALPILPEGRPSRTPTTACLLEMFSYG